MPRGGRRALTSGEKVGFKRFLVVSSQLHLESAISAVSYPHKGVEGGVRSDHNVCDTRLFYALAYSPITIADWPAKKNRRSSAKNIS